MSQNTQQIAEEIVSWASKVVRDDLLWSFFGYNHRPLAGRLTSLFRSKNELHRIDFLAREFFIYALAVELKKHSSAIQLDLVGIIYTNYFFNPSTYDLSASFGFKSKIELILYFQEGLSAYKSSERDDFDQILLERFRTILGSNFKSEWLTGIARMTVHFKTW
jgi:hypothetical protein